MQTSGTADIVEVRIDASIHHWLAPKAAQATITRNLAVQRRAYWLGRRKKLVISAPEFTLLDERDINPMSGNRVSRKDSERLVPGEGSVRFDTLPLQGTLLVRAA